MKKVLSMAVLICGFGLLISGCNPEVSGGLDVPKGLKAQAESHTGISLTWTPVDGAGYYKVYRTTDSAWKEYELIDFLSYSRYSDSGLSANTTYYYRVSACTGKSDVSSSDDTESDMSEPASAITTGFDAPEGLTAQAVSTSSINLKWTPVVGATYYKVYRATDSAWEEYELIASSVSSYSTYSDNGLSANTTYYYKVSARTGGINVTRNDTESAMSEAASATTPSLSQLPAPTGLAAVVNSKLILLTWNGVEEAKGYRIYVSLNGAGGTYTYMQATDETAILVTSGGTLMALENGTYYFKVMAVYNNINALTLTVNRSPLDSELSAAVSATIP